MALLSKLRKVARQASGRSEPRILTVKKAWRLTPNMVRVVFAGPELDGFPEGREGGNCKLLLPEIDEPREAFVARLNDGPPPKKRTYTVRKYDAAKQELSIDFVAHGDEGPASRWASHAQTGDFLGFAGPSTPKLTKFEAEWYLVAADPSAIPVAAAALEAMPRDAKGVAIFEITSDQDWQEIDIPHGIKVHWIVQPNPQQPSNAQENLIRSLDWPHGRVQICIAGESTVIRSLRAFLSQEKNLPREDCYISGYWKIGLVEEDHQKAKRTVVLS